MKMASTSKASSLYGETIPADTHICGVCHCEFDDIYKFIKHKEQCSKVPITVISSSSSLEPNANIEKKSFHEASENNGTSYNNLDNTNCENFSKQKTLHVLSSHSQPEVSLQDYNWQADELSTVSHRGLSLVVEPQEVAGNNVSFNNNNLPHSSNNSSSPSVSKSHSLSLEQDSSSTISLAGQSADLTSEDGHSTSSQMPPCFLKEVLHPNRHPVHEISNYDNSNLLEAIKTESLNSIDNAAVCPEDLEVRQISAAMFGKLSKRFSSKTQFGTGGHSVVMKGSVVDGSVSSLKPVIKSVTDKEEMTACRLSNVNCDRTDFVTYRNLNTLSVPVSHQSLGVSRRQREGRERLPGISGDMLNLTPPVIGSRIGHEDVTQDNKNEFGKTNLVDSVAPQTEITKLSELSTSEPKFTSYKAIFTSSACAGYRLAPDIPESSNPTLLNSLPSSSLRNVKLLKAKSTSENISQDDSQIQRDNTTVSYKDLSKLVKIKSSTLHKTSSSGQVSAVDIDSSSSSQGAPSLSFLENGTCSVPSNTTNGLNVISEYRPSQESVVGDNESVVDDKSLSTHFNTKPVGLIEDMQIQTPTQSIESSVVDLRMPVNAMSSDTNPDTSSWNIQMPGQYTPLPPTIQQTFHDSNHATPSQIQSQISTGTGTEHQEGETILMVVNDQGNSVFVMCPASIQQSQVSINESQGQPLHNDNNEGVKNEGNICHPDDVHHIYFHEQEAPTELVNRQENFLIANSQLQLQSQSPDDNSSATITASRAVHRQSDFITSLKGDSEQHCILNNGSNNVTSEQVKPQSQGTVAPIQFIPMDNNVKAQAALHVVNDNNNSVPQLILQFNKNSSESISAKSSRSKGHGKVAIKSPKAAKELTHKLRSKSSSPFHKQKLKKVHKTCTHSSHKAKGNYNVANSNVSDKDAKTDHGINVGKKNDRSFMCKFGSCSYQTTQYKDFQRHYRTHTGEKPYKCSICPKTFIRSDKLTTHMRWHYGLKPFHCKICDYACLESSSLRKHMRIHNDERPFQCQICPYASRNSSQLIVHLRTHTGDSPFHCSVCSARFKVNSDLKRHMRIHTGDKPFKCEHCDYRSSYKGNLKTHNKINHAAENEKQCPHCSYTNSSLRRIREHIKTHDAARVMKCFICPYTCNNAAGLRSHMMVHDTNKPYRCSICQYSCKQSGNLRKHMQNIHGCGERWKIFMDPAGSKNMHSSTISSSSSGGGTGGRSSMNSGSHGTNVRSSSRNKSGSISISSSMPVCTSTVSRSVSSNNSTGSSNVSSTGSHVVASRKPSRRELLRCESRSKNRSSNGGIGSVSGSGNSISARIVNVSSGNGRNSGGRNDDGTKTGANASKRRCVRPSTKCRKMYVCHKCDCGFVRQDSLRCHLRQHQHSSSSEKHQVSSNDFTEHSSTVKCLPSILEEGIQRAPIVVTSIITSATPTIISTYNNNNDNNNSYNGNSNNYNNNNNNSYSIIHNNTNHNHPFTQQQVSQSSSITTPAKTHGGLDHILAAASQMYQEQYLKNDDTHQSMETNKTTSDEYCKDNNCHTSINSRPSDFSNDNNLNSTFSNSANNFMSGDSQLVGSHHYQTTGTNSISNNCNRSTSTDRKSSRNNYNNGNDHNNSIRNSCDDINNALSNSTSYIIHNHDHNHNHILSIRETATANHDNNNNSSHNLMHNQDHSNDHNHNPDSNFNLNPSPSVAIPTSLFINTTLSSVSDRTVRERSETQIKTTADSDVTAMKSDNSNPLGTKSSESGSFVSPESQDNVIRSMKSLSKSKQRQLAVKISSNVSISNSSGCSGINSRSIRKIISSNCRGNNSSSSSSSDSNNSRIDCVRSNVTDFSSSSTSGSSSSGGSSSSNCGGSSSGAIMVDDVSSTSIVLQQPDFVNPIPPQPVKLPTMRGGAVSLSKPLTVVSGLPQSLGVQGVRVLVQHHPNSVPLQTMPVSSLNNSQPATVAMAHEPREVGLSGTNAVTFQVIPQASALTQSGTQISALTQSGTQISALTQSGTQISALSQLGSRQISALTQPSPKISAVTQLGTQISAVTQPGTQISALTQPGTQISALTQPGTQISALSQLGSGQISALTQSGTQISALSQLGSRQISALTQPSPNISAVTKPGTQISAVTQSSTQISSLTQPGTQISALTQHGTQISALTQPGTQISALTQLGTQISALTQPSTQISALTQPSTQISALTQHRSGQISAVSQHASGQFSVQASLPLALPSQAATPIHISLPPGTQLIPQASTLLAAQPQIVFQLTGTGPNGQETISLAPMDSQTLNMSTIPNQSLNVSTIPNQPLNVSTIPNQPLNVSTMPNQPLNVSTIPNQPINVSTVSNQPLNVSTMPNQPLNVSTIPNQPLNVSTIPNQPLNVSTIPNQPINVSTVSNQAIVSSQPKQIVLTQCADNESYHQTSSSN